MRHRNLGKDLDHTASNHQSIDLRTLHNKLLGQNLQVMVEAGFGPVCR